MAQLAEIVNKFSANIYQQCIEGKSSNVILSPFSIQSALSLTLMGAAGQTADEMISIMQYGNLKHDDIANHFENFMETIKKNPSVLVANKIYFKDGFTVKSTFEQRAVKQFQSEIEGVNFGKNVEAANAINQWVESKTNKKIKDLIDAGSLSNDTRMVLVNAIYFKGFWEHQFKPEHTKPGKFWTDNSTSVEVPMMYNNKKYNFGIFDNIDAKGIELKYKDSDISMFILLPNKRDGLPALEAKLNEINLNDLYSNLHMSDVELTMPKFKIEFEINLNDTLKKMGMGTMFSERADFSEMLETSEDLQVSEVVHKAFIEVNEEGAEAAAATAVMVSFCAFIEPTQFAVDHPFYFVLKDTKTHITYFSGRINKPSTA